PVSTSTPSTVTVPAFPPMAGAFSRTSTRSPAAPNRIDAESPPMPAPITITSTVLMTWFPSTAVGVPWRPPEFFLADQFLASYPSGSRSLRLLEASGHRYDGVLPPFGAPTRRGNCPGYRAPLQIGARGRLQDVRPAAANPGSCI